MIKVKNLTKSFNDNKVLDGLDFEIQEGEIVGLLGPNGAGKTTTLRILTGYLPFEQGEVEILKNKIDSEKERLKVKEKIGYLPENNPLYEEMLVVEYLYYMADLKKISKGEVEKVIREVVKKTGLESVYWRPIKELSKGFRQRVGLAASILADPEILILDEPTEGLDPNQRIDIRNLIKNLGQNKTVIISSHVLSEVENTCDRIIIINKGKVVADGKTREVLQQEAHKGRKLILEIEGKNVKDKIKELIRGENFELTSEQGERVRMEIALSSKKEIRPEISQLVKENNWIIWEVRIQESRLEDVFREVTK